MNFTGKTLTIFGCGYVGTAFAEQAVKKEMQVTALTRNPEKAENLRKIGVNNVIEAELHTREWHKHINPNQDFILNSVSSAGGGIEGYIRSYIEGQKSISDWLKEGSAGTFVYTSSTGVYPQDDGVVVTEESSNDGASETGEILLKAEDILKAMNAVQRWFVLRLCGIYGPGRHYMLDQLRANRDTFPGTGEKFLNLIHRDDICSAIWTIFGANVAIKNSIYNLCDGNYSTKAEVLSWLADQCGIAKVSFDAEASSVYQARGVVPNRRIDASKIREETGWEPMYSDFKAGYASILEK